MADSAGDLALLGSLFGAPPEDPFPGTPREAPRPPAGRRGRAAPRPTAAGAATLAHDGDVIEPLIAREEAAEFAYRGAAPRGAPRSRRAARQHAAALRTELQALGRGITPLSADALDPAARRFAAASTPGRAWPPRSRSRATSSPPTGTRSSSCSEPGILQTAATILAGHAQQRALLARLAGRDPFGG